MMKRMRKRRPGTAFAAFCAVAVAIGFHGPAAAQSVESFYRDRTVEIVIGSGMGGSYGVYSQLAARYMPKYIPGNPTMVVRSRVGAGGQTALRYLYNAAPRDGSVMALIPSAVLFDTMLSENPGYDAGAFQYIGRYVNNDFVGLVDIRSGIESLEDAKTKKVVFGALGVRNALATGPAFVNRVAGTKIQIITGYEGVARLFQAVEQREVDGLSSTVVTPRYLQLLAARRQGQPPAYRPIYTIALRPLPDLPDVPSIMDMNMSDEERVFLQIFASQGFLGRSLAFPPDVPQAHVDAFRGAFEAMLKDDAFVAEVERTETPIAAMSGQEVQDAIRAIIAQTPKDQVVKAAKVYQDILDSLRK